MSSKLNNVYGGSDGVLVNTLHTSRKGVTGVLTQPSEDLILKRNQELRKNKGALKDLSFGRQVASIPYISYLKLREDHEKLRDPDAKVRSMEMIRLLQLPEYQQFLVQEHV